MVADVFVREGQGGMWRVELNTDTLPRLLVDHRYHAVVSGAARTGQEKTFVSDCMAQASWLIRSLDQRAKTILRSPPRSCASRTASWPTASSTCAR